MSFAPVNLNLLWESSIAFFIQLSGLSGADLKERATMKQSDVGAFVAKLRETFSQLEFCPIPTICALDGKIKRKVDGNDVGPSLA